jgi:nucleotide-binding universal stress UspA family protein
MSTAAIVTGTDGSDSATAAVRQAAALAGSSGVALHVVSAYPAGGGAPQDAVRAILESACDALAGVDAESSAA